MIRAIVPLLICFFALAFPSCKSAPICPEQSAVIIKIPKYDVSIRFNVETKDWRLNDSLDIKINNYFEDSLMVIEQYLYDDLIARENYKNYFEILIDYSRYLNIITLEGEIGTDKHYQPLLDGKRTTYYPDGSLKSEEFFIRGIEELRKGNESFIWLMAKLKKR